MVLVLSHIVMLSPGSQQAGLNLAKSSLSPRPLRISKLDMSLSPIDTWRSPKAPCEKHGTHMDDNHNANTSFDATPRAANHYNHRKSSSYSILRTQTPKLLTKLRSFSNGRVSSSRATCRRYSTDSRDSSSGSDGNHRPGQLHFAQDRFSNFGSSSSEGSYDSDPVMPLHYDSHTLGSYGLHQDSDPVSRFHEPVDPFLDPNLLVPEVRVIPEMTTIRDGSATV